MVIAWVNVLTMLVAMFLFAYLYVRSVGPAALERKIGAQAYPLCARYRAVSMIFMIIVLITFVIYYLHPLPIPFPRTFPWPGAVSIAIAVLLALPASYFMIRGLMDAGEEALIPKKEHAMYGGIYNRVRHPQAWEAVYWFVAAFALNSPFLTCVAVVGLFLEYWMVMAEEPDLALRYGEAYEAYRRSVPPFWPRRKG